MASLRALNAMFGEAFDDRASYALAPPGDAWCHDLLADPGVVLLVAEEAGQAVGGIAAYVLRKFEQERSEIYIYDLAVAEPHRRRGIATALIAETRRFAREVGAWMIFVQGDAGDEAALALYRKLAASEERPHHFDILP